METLYQFIIELDKLKSVYRGTYITDISRKENSAEHSWHSALAILMFKDQFQLDVDILKTIKMALIHDICEIDDGDTFIYSKGRTLKHDAERACIKRISEFPLVFASEIKELWDEYEAQETKESHWVKVADRLIPFMVNIATEGKLWLEYGITKKQVIETNQVIKKRAPEAFEWMLIQIDKAVKAGWLADA